MLTLEYNFVQVLACIVFGLEFIVIYSTNGEVTQLLDNLLV